MSLEIFQNTLLQLIVRQGTDSTRRNVVLKSGELGYTTDTKKLYVGDGSTLGGVLVGGGYAGSAANITTLAPASLNDLAFDTDNNKLYRLRVNDGSNIGDWELIGGAYSAADNTLNITSDNRVSVGVISGGNISPNSFSDGILLNGSNQISLSARVSLDEILPKNGNSLKLPNILVIGDNTYTFSTDAPLEGQVFYIDGGQVKTRDIAFINNAVGYTPQVAPLSAQAIARNNIGAFPDVVYGEIPTNGVSSAILDPTGSNNSITISAPANFSGLECVMGVNSSGGGAGRFEINVGVEDGVGLSIIVGDSYLVFPDHILSEGGDVDGMVLLPYLHNNRLQWATPDGSGVYGGGRSRLRWLLKGEYGVNAPCWRYTSDLFEFDDEGNDYRLFENVLDPINGTTTGNWVKFGIGEGENSVTHDSFFGIQTPRANDVIEHINNESSEFRASNSSGNNGSGHVGASGDSFTLSQNSTPGKSGQIYIFEGFFDGESLHHAFQNCGSTLNPFWKKISNLPIKNPS